MAASQATTSEPAGLYATPSAEEVRALREHPQFPAALRFFAAGLVDIYDGNRLLNQVLNDRGRLVLSFLVLYLHFSGGAEGLPGGGFTTSRLTAHCVETGICSPGRAVAMLALMRFGGYLQSAASTTDRRTKVLVPTDRMIAAVQERLTCQFGALALLLPEGGEALARVSDIEFVAALSRRLGERFLAGARPLLHAPELHPLMERNAGLMVVLSLFLAGKPDDTFPPTRPVRISISALARRFAVSRPHVINLLRDAEQEGFLRRDGLQGEEIVVLPLLSDAAQNFFATVFLYQAKSAREALADLKHDPRTGKVPG
jgi:DNA-binding MarR family transcriptional regulator